MSLYIFGFWEKLISGRIAFYKVFLICLLLSLLNSFLFSLIAYVFFPTLNLDENPIDKLSFWEQFFLGCILAPLFETWIYMVLANKILIKLGVKNILVLIVTPALLFGVSHYYNLLYIAAMIVAGLNMNFLYIYCKHFKGSRDAFLYVVLLHAIYNTVSIFC